MSFMDKAKDALNQAKDKAADLAEQHGDKIDKAIDKSGDFIDQKTKGKYSDKIDSAQASARNAADKLAQDNDDATPPPAAAVPDPAAPVPTPPPAPPVRPADEGGPSVRPSVRMAHRPPAFETPATPRRLHRSEAG